MLGGEGEGDVRGGTNVEGKDINVESGRECNSGGDDGMSNSTGRT